MILSDSRNNLSKFQQFKIHFLVKHLQCKITKNIRFSKYFGCFAWLKKIENLLCIRQRENIHKYIHFEFVHSSIHSKGAKSGKGFLSIYPLSYF